MLVTMFFSINMNLVFICLWQHSD